MIALFSEVPNQNLKGPNGLDEFLFKGVIAAALEDNSLEKLNSPLIPLLRHSEKIGQQKRKPLINGILGSYILKNTIKYLEKIISIV